MPVYLFLQLRLKVLAHIRRRVYSLLTEANNPEQEQMNKKAAATIATLNAERETLVARMAALDDVFCAGNGSDSLESEFYAADARVREIGSLIREAGRPSGRICRNTAALISANID